MLSFSDYEKNEFKKIYWYFVIRFSLRAIFIKWAIKQQQINDLYTTNTKLKKNKPWIIKRDNEFFT